MLTKKEFENVIAGNTNGSKAMILKSEMMKPFMVVVEYAKILGNMTSVEHFSIEQDKQYGTMWVTNDELFEYLGTERFVGADAMMLMSSSMAASFGISGDFGVMFLYELAD